MFFFTYRNTFFQMTRGSLYLLRSNAISERSTTTLFTCRPALTRKRVFIISEIKRKAKESLGSEKSGKASAFKFRFPPVNASECVLSLMRFVAARCRRDAAAAQFNFNSGGIRAVFVSLGSMESGREDVSSGRWKLMTKDDDGRAFETRVLWGRCWWTLNCLHEIAGFWCKLNDD